MNPRVSFVIPSYNYGQYLPYCLNSILNQTFRDTEIIVVDDASTDETPGVMAEFCERDNRVRYVRHDKNIGPVANWNACIQEARGDLIWLISADDALATDKVLARFVDEFENYPRLGFVFCRAQIIDDTSTPQGKYIPRQGGAFPMEEPCAYQGHEFLRYLAQENFVPVLSTLARRTCYEQVAENGGPFDPELVHTGDWYNWLRFSLHWDVFFNPEPMAYYRIHGGNLSTSYENRAYPVDNILLTYRKLRAYIRSRDLPIYLIKWLNRAEARFKKQKNLPLSPREWCTYRYAKWRGFYL